MFSGTVAKRSHHFYFVSHTLLFFAICMYFFAVAHALGFTVMFSRFVGPHSDQT